MALNNDLTDLMNRINQVDTFLVAADGFFSKYPRLFSADARTNVAAARGDIKNVTKELQNGADLVAQISNAVKGV